MRMVWQTKHFGKERFHSHNLLIVAAVLILCVAAEKCADRFARGKPTTPDGKTIIRGIHLWNIGIRSRYKNSPGAWLPAKLVVPMRFDGR